MLIRYPGSKDKHLKFLDELLLQHCAATRSIVEPFAGTASITFHLLQKKAVDFYVINDIDPGMTALWTAVKEDPDTLKKMIEEYVPTVEDFYAFKNDIGQEGTITGFRKLVLHQISYSGLGGKAGGPLGGAKQQSAYGVDCRWSPARLQKNIDKCSSLLNSVPGKILNKSWDAIVTDYGQEHFLYLDPPYYVKGGELYVNGNIDHEGLAASLRKCPSWLLSYDDAPEIRALYEWADIQRLDVLSHLHHKVISDVAITQR